MSNRQRRRCRAALAAASAGAAAISTTTALHAPVPAAAVTSSNTTILDCNDDPTYRSRLGLACSDHVLYGASRVCDAYGKIGFTSKEVSEMKARCPQSCGACSHQNTSTSSTKEEWEAITSISAADRRIEMVDILHASFATSTTRTNSGRTIQRVRPCYPGWSASCQDDPLYKSKMRVPCWRHTTLDCGMFGHIGFDDGELLDLVTSCPCSCGIECGSFSISPSSAPSEEPSGSPSARPSASPFSSPSASPSGSPSSVPSSVPSSGPSSEPSSKPSSLPSKGPSIEPSVTASAEPSISFRPSAYPSRDPSVPPTSVPTHLPSRIPSRTPSVPPTTSVEPSSAPSPAPDIITWSTTQSGLLQPESDRHGWKVNDKGLYLSFASEKSADCFEGGNMNEQKGTATARFFVPDGKRIALNYTLGGLGEAMDGGYEEMVFYINGIRIASSTSTALGIECFVNPVQVTYEVEPPYILKPGLHTLRVDFSTFDDYDHYGIVYVILFDIIT
mmetsp:Transcript_36639/g.80143  ORF Transcript_36639/g.80143 Transcript_36639/m.80143 type:complete len:503 (+) Transcript_36639:152-1660(+)